MRSHERKVSARAKGPFSPDRDTHRLRANVTWSAVFVAAYLCWSLRLPPLWGARSAWDVPGDIWADFGAALYVVHGGYAFLYEAGRNYDALPLPAIIMAPSVWLGEHWHLVAGYPFYLKRPTMWLPMAPVAALTCTPVVWASRALAWELGVRHRLYLVQLNAVLLVSVPCALFGHFEDALAAAGLFMTWRAVATRSWLRAGLWCGFAVASKQWAVLAVPVLLVQVPKGQRARFTTMAVGLPLLTVAPCLLRDFAAAAGAPFASITGTVPATGHPGLLNGVVPGALARVAVVVAAPVAAVLFRKCSLRSAMMLVGGLLALRVAVEPVVFLYYLAAPSAVLAMLVLSSRRRVGFVQWTATLVPTVLASPMSIDPVLWWSGVTAGAAALAIVIWLSNRQGQPAEDQAMRSPLTMHPDGEAISALLPGL